MAAILPQIKCVSNFFISVNPKCLISVTFSKKNLPCRCMNPFHTEDKTYPELHHLLLFFCFHNCVILFKLLHAFRIQLHVVCQKHKSIRICFSTRRKIFLEELQCRFSSLYGFQCDTNRTVMCQS